MSTYVSNSVSDVAPVGMTAALAGAHLAGIPPSRVSSVVAYARKENIHESAVNTWKKNEKENMNYRGIQLAPSRPRMSSNLFFLPRKSWDGATVYRTWEERLNNELGVTTITSS